MIGIGDFLILFLISSAFEDDLNEKQSINNTLGIGIIYFHEPFIKNYPMIKLPCLSNELTLSDL